MEDYPRTALDMVFIFDGSMNIADFIENIYHVLDYFHDYNVYARDQIVLEMISILLTK